MLDIKFIRENSKQVVEGIKNRGVSVDIGRLLKIAEERSALIKKVETLRAGRKAADKPSRATLAALKKNKSELVSHRQRLKSVEAQYDTLVMSVPNIYSPDTPVGKDETDNQELRTWGKPRKFNFPALDHLEIGKRAGWLDFERAAKVAGTRFVFAFGPAVELELALLRYALDIVTKRGYQLVDPPLAVKKRIIEGKGLLGEKEISLNVYKIEGEDLYLIGTGEIPLAGLHADETLKSDQLPLKYAAFTPCFRKEAGTYGKHAKGLFRMHQFGKLEIYQLIKPEKSDEALDEMLALEEEIVRGLGIPYRVMAVCTGDMAPYLYKQYDIEYWSPADQGYRELMSAGNARDFQSRRLSIRYRDGRDGKDFVHTLNATAAPLSRLPIAIMENFQRNDGSVSVPQVLTNYLGRKIL